MSTIQMMEGADVSRDSMTSIPSDLGNEGLNEYPWVSKELLPNE